MNFQNKIFLFTQSFPYKHHQTEFAFLNLEIKYLIKQFNLTIFPLHISHEQYDISDKILINTSLAKHYQNKKFLFLHYLKSIFSPLLINEILIRPKILLSPKKVFSLIIFIKESISISKWAASQFSSNNFEHINNSIFYTYWFTFVTTGLLISPIEKLRKGKIISRAHGIDLYEERQGYLPLQKIAIKKLYSLILPSQAGYDYLIKKFPKFRNQLMVSRLGTMNHNFITKSSNDGKFRLVSCSLAVPIKRIDLILEGLVEISHCNSYNIIWHHIGDGPELKYIENRYNNLRNSFMELKVYFHGYLPNKEVFDFYNNNPIDCFISTSASEGGVPVSIQEAQSFGIPVIATKVGGIPEIVLDGKTGFLLNQNVGKEQIAEKISLLINNPVLLKKLKVNSRKNWEQKFDASINFNAFTRKLTGLLS